MCYYAYQVARKLEGCSKEFGGNQTIVSILFEMAIVYEKYK